MGKGLRNRDKRRTSREIVKDSDLKKEIKKQVRKEVIQEVETQYVKELDSAVLYILWKEFGFGEVRIRRFWDSFVREYSTLRQRYESEGCVDRFMRDELKQHTGVDLQQLEREIVC